MASLPITEALPQLRQALRTHRNVVLQAPPGAGKSTGVPLTLLDEDWLKSGKILMLEPRRIAARAVAMRMSSTLGEPAGRTVGYRTRLDTKVSAATRIEVVTEGILTRMLQRDAALEGIALVIFDEFHERSLQADLGLALCLDMQVSLREELKLLVMSATLDGAAVARLLGDAPIVTSEGRAFPIETRYRTRKTADTGTRERDIVREVASVVMQALEQESGDALVFLPGQGEIRRVQQLLQDAGLLAGTDVLPLFGDLSAADQDRAVQPSIPGRRKIVLATNIAETSLTIDGVRIVVDAGLERRARFDPAIGMSRLETVRIARASADQRRGRAGRLEPGVCYRLWLESEHESLAAQAPAEITEADLAPLALELAGWGVQDPATLRWLDMPPAGAFAQARTLLAELGAIGTDGRVTAHGRQMSALGTHPRLAHLLLRARESGLTRLGAEIAAVLGERDLLRSHVSQRDVDFRLRVEALHGAAPPGMEVDRGAKQRILRSAEMFEHQLGSTARGASPQDEDIGALLAFAYPDRIAQNRGAGGRYLLSGGRGASLANPQLLANVEYLVVAELDAGDREARIRLAAPITRAMLEKDFAESIRTAERIEWDAQEMNVVARRERWLGALKLEEQRLNDADADRIAAALLAGIRMLGIEVLPWTKEARALRARMEFLRANDERSVEPWPEVNDAALLRDLEHWLGPWLSGMTRKEHLARLDLHAALRGLLSWNQQQRLDELAPTHLTVPSGSRIPIDYGSTPPTLSVRLQEVFGLLETPRVGGGRVALLMQLLSPAHRPVQLTQDLASFWSRGYQDVKKDLKGRYPKHYWPDDPLQAQATARAKPRS